ncbi:hypothetical protein ASG04_01445 [Curtobacterium sp. Leaf183]|uniref:excalibur calcium-binding domain-containing protein n=1 Tax=Curtobacterium sp. Leaf183 TaxID=1736291 RepID=UPI0006FD59E3|nr:excalibur calcium-binding domain-containing protein [Curtobacterium sp. Leaf183]KQS14550.1 hypothetical protein ASG04_01445 [Curtobacterium sp. Leaf183]
MRIITSIGVTATALALAATVSLGTATPAEAAATVYKNCDAVHKVYSGGIAKKSVTQNRVTTKGKVTYRALQGTVKKDDALYAANKKSDADGDGIACEIS